MAKKEDKPIGIEEGLKRLDHILEMMEDPQIELKESFEYYEEGINLLKMVNEELEEMEQKIEVLSQDGKIVEMDLDEE